MHGIDFLLKYCKWHYSLDIDNFTKEKIILTYRLSIIIVLAMPQKPIYRQNQDYTQQFDWTYDLKRDVNNCSIKARENKSIGHAKRLKSYWDESHPKFAFLSHKNLRDVASHIVVKKVVVDTEFDNTTFIITEADIVNNEIFDKVKSCEYC